MKIKNLLPKPTNKQYFDKFHVKSIPKISGCYALATLDDEILYIGLASKNLRTRFKSHLKDSKKIGLTKLGKAMWFYFEFRDDKNVNKLERDWQTQFILREGELPVLNEIRSPIL